MTTEERKETFLRNLRGGLNFLPDSSQQAAALVIGLHTEALKLMHTNGTLSVEEAVEELRMLYVVVEAAHPGCWEMLGGPPLPDALTA